MAVTDDMIAQLVADGVGVAAVTLFADGMPDAPDACVSLVEYGSGRPSEYQYGAVKPWKEWPRVSVVARGPIDDAVTARTKVSALRNSLAKMANATVNGATFHEVTFLQAAFLLKVDERGRYCFACNVELGRLVPAGE